MKVRVYIVMCDYLPSAEQHLYNLFFFDVRL
jgi:hypothetical protein